MPLLFIAIHTIAILKVKRTYEARGNQFLFQNIQNKIFEVFKMFRNNMEFTREVF